MTSRGGFLFSTDRRPHERHAPFLSRIRVERHRSGPEHGGGRHGGVPLPHGGPGRPSDSPGRGERLRRCGGDRGAVAAVTDTPGNGSLGDSGGYAMIYDAKKREVRSLDYIGAAPAAARPEMFTEGSRLWDRAHPARDSYLGTLVPGSLAGIRNATAFSVR